MNTNIKNLIGKKFSRLTVLNYDLQSSGSGHAVWLCQCICGNKITARGSHLVNKNIRSCGCLQKEKAGSLRKRKLLSKMQKGENNSFFKHGLTRTQFYNIYRGLRQRCEDKNQPTYPRYGGRGIKNKWKDFKQFKDEMYESYLIHIKRYGYDDTSLDRMDNNGNYCKENCRWATKKEQSRNRNDNHLISHNGMIMTVVEWNEYLGLPKGTVQKRIGHGWTEERSVSTPLMKIYGSTRKTGTN